MKSKKNATPKLKKTHRGFAYFQFNDRNGNSCSLQKSSIATEDCIWLGIDDANPQIMASKIIEGGTGWAKYPIPEDVLLTTRMHLNVEQAKWLVDRLQVFLETAEVG